MIALVNASDLWNKKWAKVLLYSSFLLVVLGRILLVADPSMVKINRLKEFHGWKTWAKDVQYVCQDRPLVANTYQIASKLSFYLDKEVSALNYHSRKNQFDYWKFHENLPTKEVCYITDKVEFNGIPYNTPEGKTLRIVKNQSMESLLKLKYEESGN
jgi:hypothetical protein